MIFLLRKSIFSKNCETCPYQPKAGLFTLALAALAHSPAKAYSAFAYSTDERAVPA